MKIEITYPQREKRDVLRSEIKLWSRWFFLASAYVCPILNLYLGGKAWSVIVLWSLQMVWSSAFSLAVVEYNRVSQITKTVIDVCILLLLIDLLLVPGSLLGVIPIVCFGGLLLVGTLFFTDLERQKQNMMPLWLFVLGSFALATPALIFWKANNSWALLLTSLIAFGILLAGLITLGRELLREFRKRFHVR